VADASASRGTPFLRIAGLRKRFGSFTALDGIDLEIGRGEFVCFLGPSGCGKTTLLRAIAGLDAQDEGRIEIAGRDLSRAAPSERDFGIVFQSYALFPNLTVAGNIGYGLVNRRVKRTAIQARVAELLALVGMPGQDAKYPAQLSGGQQQRVALARALATAPGLLLLDEPLSALDAKVRVRLRDEIKGVQRRLSVTTVMVTHDQEEALAIADRIVVMNHGIVEQVGTPEEIYCNPRTAFVAEFVGAMSFLDAVVTGPGRVRAGELDLACSTEVGFLAGSPVRLGLRPEEIRVRGVAADDPNAIRVAVRDVSFLGAFCRAELAPEIATTGPIVADFSANAMRDLGIVAGRSLLVSLPPASLRPFPIPALP
jgi:iron(III) transport system ATP-binding protein